MIVRDGDVGRRASRLDGDVIVAGVDEAMRDGDVGGSARVDAVGIAGILRRVDNDAPRGESAAIAVVDVKVGGVLECNAIEREVIGVREHDQTRAVLKAAGARFLGQIPPGDILADQFRAAAAVDRAFPHHGGAGDAIAVDQGPAAAPAFIDGSQRPGETSKSRGLREAYSVAPAAIRSVTPDLSSRGPERKAARAPSGCNSTACPGAQVSRAR